MKLEQLQQVEKIAEFGSFNKAAKEMYVSQSNLSQSIKALEEEIGRPIFTRSAKGIQLTTFGAEFLRHARAACNQFQLASNFCKTYHDHSLLNFSIACQYMHSANMIFMELCKQYKDNHLEFHFLEGSLLEVTHYVLKNEAEIGLIVISNKQRDTTISMIKAQGLAYTPIETCPAAVLVSKENPLYHATQSNVTLNSLKPYPAVMYRDTSFNFASEIADFNFYTSQNRIIVSDRATLHEILDHSNAYSVVALSHLNQNYNSNYYEQLRMLTLPDKSISFEIGWIKKSHQPLSDLATEYINMINLYSQQLY